MKQLGAGLAAHIAGGVTTLARLWQIIRRDGLALGFTDHDRDLTIAGITYRSATGVSQSELTLASGLGAGGQEIAGALSSDAISEADIAAGLWDGAEVKGYLVNWADPAQIVHQTTHVLGEVTRKDGAFTAELRSLSALLDQPKGRLFQHRCDAVLGDGRCGIDLSAWRGTGSVVKAERDRRLTEAGLGAFAGGLFAQGRLTFTSGANTGRAVEVKADGAEFGARILDLWSPPGEAISAGDAFTVTAGCDRRFETCRDRFANGLNFRGFPHIPGSDFAVASPVSSSHPNDGEALVL